MILTYMSMDYLLIAYSPKILFSPNLTDGAHFGSVAELLALYLGYDPPLNFKKYIINY
jgi:hypothetical protein